MIATLVIIIKDNYSGPQFLFGTNELAVGKAADCIFKEEVKYLSRRICSSPRILQISAPFGTKPGLRFCTVPHSYSEVTLRNHKPAIHDYVKRFNSKCNVTQDAIAAVKDG